MTLSQAVSVFNQAAFSNAQPNLPLDKRIEAGVRAVMEVIEEDVKSIRQESQATPPRSAGEAVYRVFISQGTTPETCKLWDDLAPFQQAHFMALADAAIQHFFSSFNGTLNPKP